MGSIDWLRCLPVVRTTSEKGPYDGAHQKCGRASMLWRGLQTPLAAATTFCAAGPDQTSASHFVLAEKMEQRVTR
jgi:hypothetical protein